MQNKELYYIIQVISGQRYLKEHGFVPVWKDLDFYSCGMKQKYKLEAQVKANKKLEYYEKEKKGTYRIIKRYIKPKENKEQLKLDFTFHTLNS